jgi:hypothetical protein
MENMMFDLNKYKSQALVAALKIINDPRVMKIVSNPRVMNVIYKGLKIKDKVDATIKIWIEESEE